MSTVACASRTECFAVGYQFAVRPTAQSVQSYAYRPQALIESYNGGTWRPVTLRTPSKLRSADVVLSAVTCASATHCVALGTSSPLLYPVDDIAPSTNIPNRLVTAVWNGRTWRLERVRSHPESLYRVKAASCATPVLCVAVATADIGVTNHTQLQFQPVIEVWNGRTWSQETPPSWKGYQWNGRAFKRAEKGLYGVDCRPDGSCVLVGGVSGFVAERGAACTGGGGPRGSGNTGFCGPVYPMIETLDHGHWSAPDIQMHSDGHSRTLISVSCASNSTCLAVGADDGGAGGPTGAPFRLLADQFNGQGWSTSTLRENYAFIEHVACPTTMTCLATGAVDTTTDSVVATFSPNWAATPS